MGVIRDAVASDGSKETLLSVGLRKINSNQNLSLFSSTEIKGRNSTKHGKLSYDYRVIAHIVDVKTIGILALFQENENEFGFKIEKENWKSIEWLPSTVSELKVENILLGIKDNYGISFYFFRDQSERIHGHSFLEAECTLNDQSDEEIDDIFSFTHLESNFYINIKLSDWIPLMKHLEIEPQSVSFLGLAKDNFYLLFNDTIVVKLKFSFENDTPTLKYLGSANLETKVTEAGSEGNIVSITFSNNLIYIANSLNIIYLINSSFDSIGTIDVPLYLSLQEKDIGKNFNIKQINVSHDQCILGLIDEEKNLLIIDLVDYFILLPETLSLFSILKVSKILSGQNLFQVEKSTESQENSENQTQGPFEDFSNDKIFSYDQDEEEEEEDHEQRTEDSLLNWDLPNENEWLNNAGPKIVKGEQVLKTISETSDFLTTPASIFAENVFGRQQPWTYLSNDPGLTGFEKVSGNLNGTQENKNFKEINLKKKLQFARKFKVPIQKVDASHWRGEEIQIEEINSTYLVLKRIEEDHSQLPTDIIVIWLEDEKDESILIGYPFEKLAESEEEKEVLKKMTPVWIQADYSTTQIPNFLYMDETTIGILLRGYTRQHLLNNVMMFETSFIADRLCRLNKWDRRLLSMRALDLGLAHRQLDVIADALTNLTSDQYLFGCQLILNALEDDLRSTTSGATSEFVEQLVQMGITFVSNILYLKTEQMRKDWSQRGGDVKIIQDLINSTHTQEIKPGEIEIDPDSKLQLFLNMTKENEIGFSPLICTVNPEELTLLDDFSKELFTFSKILEKMRQYILLSPRLKKGLGRTTEETEEVKKESSKSQKFNSQQFEEFPLDKTILDTYQRWSKLSSIQIVEDALKTGRLSLALSYFKKENLLSIGTKGVKRKGSSTQSLILSLDSIWSTAFSLIFHTIRKKNIASATQMICNIGVDPKECLKEILFYTTDRGLRNYLITDFHRKGQLPEESVEAAAFISNLETGTLNFESYSAEQQRLSENSTGLRRMKHLRNKEQLQNSRNLETGDIFDSDEIGYTFQSQNYNQALSFSPSLSQSPEDESNRNIRSRANSTSSLASSIFGGGQLTSSHYFQTIFKWVLGWNELTKEMILLDVKGPLNSIITFSHWLYGIKHHDLELIQQLLIESTKLLNSQTEQEALFNFCYQNSSRFLQEQLGIQLAKIKIVDLKSSKENLAKILSSVGKLFSDPSNFPLSDSLAFEFHGYMLRYVTESKLPRFLSLYMTKHELGKSIKPSKEEQILWDSSINAPWISMIYHLKKPSKQTREQLNESLKSAAIFNAFHVFQLPPLAQEKFNVNLVLSKGRSLIAIGTLALAGIKLRTANEAPKDSMWYLDIEQLRKNLEPTFPLLAMAISRRIGSQSSLTDLSSSSSSNSLNSTSLQSLSPLENSPNSFTLIPTFKNALFDPSTPTQDITIYELLESSLTELNIDRLLLWQRKLISGSSSSQESYPQTLNSQGGLPVSMLSKQLELQQTEQKQLSKDTFNNFNSFIEKILPDLAFKDQLDYTYYILGDRPLKATELARMELYQLLTTSTTTESSSTSITSSSSTSTTSSSSTFLNLSQFSTTSAQYLTQHWKKNVYEVVAKLACERFLDSNSVSSCLFFFEQCEIECQMLRIDLLIARRIFDFRELNNPQLRDQHKQDLIQTLFQLLGLKDSTNFTKKTSIQTLEFESLCHRIKDEVEKATSAQVSTLFSSQHLTTHEPQSKLLIEASRLWELVVNFCKVHELPLTKIFLEYLASNNEPFMFLYFSQVHNYPPNLLHQIVEDNVQQMSILEHLQNAIEVGHSNENEHEHENGNGNSNQKIRSTLYSNLGVKENQEPALITQSKEYVICPNILSGDIFDIVFSCQKTPTPGKSLLLYSIYRTRPLLSILATCYPDVNMIECCCVWLYASCPKQLKFMDIIGQPSPSTPGSPLSTLPILNESQNQITQIQGSNQNSNQNNQNLNPNSNQYVFPMERFQIQWRPWSLEDLSAIILSLCQTHTHRTLFEAFRLFDPQNPFLEFLMFQDAFLQHNYQISKNHLVSFVELLKGQENQPSQQQQQQQKKGGNILFGDSKWIHKVASEVVESLLNQCPTPYERRYLIKSVVEAKLDARYNKYLRTIEILDDAGIDIPVTTAPETIIDILIEKQLFNEAREFAGEQGLSHHDITLREVQYHVSEFQQSCLWDMEFTRMALWEQCHQIFMLHKCNPSIAGEYFYHLIESMDSVEECYAERSMILTFALNWFSGNIYSLHSFSPAAILSQTQEKKEKDQDRKSSNLLPPPSPRLQTRNLSSQQLSDLTSVENEIENKGDNIGKQESLSQVQSQESHELLFGTPIRSPEFLEQLENRIWLANISAELALKDSGGRFEDSIDFLGAPLSGLKIRKEIQSQLALDIDVAMKIDSSDNSNYSQVDLKTKLEQQELSRKNRLAINLVSTSFLEPEGFKVEQQEVVLKNEREVSSLNTAIGRLLNSGMVVQALTLQRQFNHNSKDILLAKTAVMIAEGLLTPEKIPDELLVPKKGSPPISKAQLTVDDALEELKRQAIEVKECIERVIGCYQASTTLNLGYKIIVAKDPYEILQLLLMCGKDVYKTAKLYIQANRLDSERVASQLADSFCKALLESDKQQDDGRRVIGSELAVDPFWTPSEFIPFANLADSPAILGHQFLKIVYEAKDTNKLPFWIEAELIIRGHYCFGLVNNMEGMEKVYQLIQERVYVYVKEGQLPLLVKLLTGIQKYREMQYIFDELIKFDMFELVLRKAMDKEGQWEFKLALRDYLLKNHPEDTERLNMVYFHFNMFREIGETLSNSAHTTLKNLCEKKEWEPNMHFIEQLLGVVQLFNEAADSFAKEDCCRAAHKCLAMARLVSMQIQIPTIRFLCLNPTDLRKLFTTHPSFSDAYIVAEAYEINQLSDWAGPIFHHVVLNGNFAYLERFRRVYPTSYTFFQELINQFRAQAQTLQRNPHYQNFQKLLEICQDKIYVYKISKEFKLQELIDKVSLSFPGVEELI